MTKLVHHVIQRKTRKQRTPKKTQNIKGIGSEIEGFWSNEDLPNYEIDYDGSVHFEGYNCESDCDGSCRDNCECYSYCECDECFTCSVCNKQINDCTCYECMMCDECNEKYEDCNCFYEKSEDCENKECSVKNGLCDDCIELVHSEQDNHIYYNCNKSDNSEFNCELDCDCECNCECDCESGNDGKCGEIASPVFVNPYDCADFIKKNYPSDTNSTCGLHIHISVKSEKAYKKLMTKRFYNYFLVQVEKWGHENKINPNSQFWKRLRGDNTYCRREFIPRIQYRSIDKNEYRYRQLNFCYNLIGKGNRKNHTLECRLFPAFQKSYLSHRAIIFFYDLVNAFLNRELEDEGLKKLPKSKELNEVIVLGV